MRASEAQIDGNEQGAGGRREETSRHAACTSCRLKKHSTKPFHQAIQPGWFGVFDLSFRKLLSFCS